LGLHFLSSRRACSVANYILLLPAGQFKMDENSVRLYADELSVKLWSCHKWFHQNREMAHLIAEYCALCIDPEGRYRLILYREPAVVAAGTGNANAEPAESSSIWTKISNLWTWKSPEQKTGAEEKQAGPPQLALTVRNESKECYADLIAAPVSEAARSQVVKFIYPDKVNFPGWLNIIHLHSDKTWHGHYAEHYEGNRIIHHRGYPSTAHNVIYKLEYRGDGWFSIKTSYQNPDLYVTVDSSGNEGITMRARTDVHNPQRCQRFKIQEVEQLPQAAQPPPVPVDNVELMLPPPLPPVLHIEHFEM
jgi:hypothetical protein